jgi:DNA-binding GntR family transcriptional regulator
MLHGNKMAKIDLKTENLNEKAYKLLKKAIIQKKFKPGERIIDAQVAETFGISRTPIRDAINILLKEGLLISKGNRGYYVLDVTEKDINEIFDIRILIEKYSIEYVITHFESVDLNDIEELFKNNKQYIQCKTINTEFHGLLVSQIKNERLIKMYNEIINQNQIFREIYSIHENKLTYTAHVNIFEAIKNKNKTLATKLLEEHLEVARGEALNFLKNNK